MGTYKIDCWPAPPEFQQASFVCVQTEVNYASTVIMVKLGTPTLSQTGHGNLQKTFNSSLCRRHIIHNVEIKALKVTSKTLKDCNVREIILWLSWYFYKDF